VARFSNSNLAEAGAGFGENLFWNHRTIYLMKLMVSTMPSSAIKRQYRSFVSFSLPVFDKVL